MRLGDNNLVWAGVKNHRRPRSFHFITAGAQIVVWTFDESSKDGLSIPATCGEKESLSHGVRLPASYILQDLDIAGKGQVPMDCKRPEKT